MSIIVGNIAGTLNVYSLADIDLLEKSFRSIAMIFGDMRYPQFIFTGFLISLLVVTIRYLITYRLELNHLFIGFLIYVCMFMPKATVLLQDINTGSARTVAGVPIGVAFPAALATTAGRTLTDLFEQATATPTLSSINNGYLDSLTVLLHFREVEPGVSVYEGTNTGLIDIQRTIRNFLTNCVMVDLNSPAPNLSPAIISTSSSMWLSFSAVNFVNINVATFLSKTPAGGNTSLAGYSLSCADTYNAINLEMGTFQPYYENVIDVYTKKALGTSAVVTLGNALTALGQSSANAQNFMINSFVRNIYREADLAYGTNFNSNVSAAIIKTQAIEGQNVKWASEQSVFLRYAKPLMSFIEMFVILIAPIAGFLVTLGPMGMSIFAKYMMVMLWTSLWAPILAMCNMYIQFAVGKELLSINSANLNVNYFTTAQGMDQLFSTAQEWVAVGGMMEAATPALAMFILTGAASSLSSITGRVTSDGASASAPSSAAPALTAGSPVMNTNTSYERDPYSGMTFKTGSESLFTSTNANATGINGQNTLRGTESGSGFGLSAKEGTRFEEGGTKFSGQNWQTKDMRNLARQFGNDYSVAANTLVNDLVHQGFTRTQAEAWVNDATVAVGAAYGSNKKTNGGGSSNTPGGDNTDSADQQNKGILAAIRGAITKRDDLTTSQADGVVRTIANSFSYGSKMSNAVTGAATNEIGHNNESGTRDENSRKVHASRDSGAEINYSENTTDSTFDNHSAALSSVMATRDDKLAKFASENGLSKPFLEAYNNDPKYKKQVDSWMDDRPQLFGDNKQLMGMIAVAKGSDIGTDQFKAIQTLAAAASGVPLRSRDQVLGPNAPSIGQTLERADALASHNAQTLITNSDKAEQPTHAYDKPPQQLTAPTLTNGQVKAVTSTDLEHAPAIQSEIKKQFERSDKIHENDVAQHQGQTSEVLSNHNPVQIGVNQAIQVGQAVAVGAGKTVVDTGKGIAKSAEQAITDAKKYLNNQ